MISPERASTTLSDSLRTTSCAADQVVGGQLGVDGHPHLAAAGVHVDGAVVVDAEQRAVGRRRLGELLDLLAEGGDVLAGLAEGVGQLLVLGDGLGQLALGLEQALLERADPLGGLLEPAAEDDDLLLELRQLLARGERVVVRRALPCALTCGADADHLLVGDLTHAPRRRPRHRSCGPMDVADCHEGFPGISVFIHREG